MTPFAFERVVKKLAGMGDPDEAAIAKVEPQFHALAGVLNRHLRGKRFLLGDTLTVADFAVATGMVFSAAARMPFEKYPEVTRWYDGFRALPAWQKSLVPPQA